MPRALFAGWEYGNAAFFGAWLTLATVELMWGEEECSHLLHCVFRHLLW